MSPETVLFLLRLGGAAVLLAFFGMIGWYIYQDVRLAAASIAAQSQPIGQLIVVANEASTPAVGTRFPLLPVTSLGRSSSNVIVLDDGYISNQHSLITRRGELWWLEDLGSRNGTLLNDAPLVDTAVISPGDMITIGNIKLKLELE
jgi:pSer/pThr/pTyr-binding forkhead associated (FHA) protein